MSDFDRSKTLQQLDGQKWGEPTYHSHLVKECHRLRQVPLREFTAEDLRILIGQQLGLPYLIPLAIEKLQSDPLIEGDLYPGDLLCNVLRADSWFWTEHDDFREQIADIATRAFALLSAMDAIDRENIENILREAYGIFLKGHL